MRIAFVTPFVGVWIETSMSRRLPLLRKVTPFVGVWIETGVQKEGHTLQIVTPFVGVWIETLYLAISCLLSKSHPSWVCGLKHTWEVLAQDLFSHTLRGCVD